MRSARFWTLAILVSMLVGSVSAQPEALRFGGVDTDLGYEVAATPDGGFIAVGFIGSGNLIDGFAVKAAADGSVDWQRTLALSNLPETIYDVLPTPDGGFVLVAGADVTGLIGYRPWLVKLDADGNEVWNSATSLTLETIVDSAIVRGTRLSSGHFAIMGGSNTMTNPEKPWLLIVDEDGERVSFEIFETLGTPGFGVATYINDLAATADGGFVATGYVSGGLGFAYLWKFDQDGSPEWDRLYLDEGFRTAQAVTALSDGGFAMAGCDLPNCNNTAVLRTNAAGESSWFELFQDPGGSYSNGRDVLERADGSLIVSQTRFSAMGSRFFDADLLELDALGALLTTWPIVVGTTSTLLDRLTATSPAGSLLGVGSVNDSTNPGDTDLLIIRKQVPAASGWIFGEDFESTTLAGWSYSQSGVDE